MTEKEYEKKIEPYIMCPAMWFTKNGLICRWDLEKCPATSDDYFQKCPKIKKFILKGFT